MIDDTLYPFMLAHWDDLMRGDAVKFRFRFAGTASAPLMFRFVKAGESVQAGRTGGTNQDGAGQQVRGRVRGPACGSPWKRTSPHRILSYTGRTTPRVKKGKAWKYLDAETVFDWPSPAPAIN